MHPIVNKIYEFEDFRLIPGEGLLLHDSGRIDLNPKAFGVLALLVERHGHLVLKSEIMDGVWEEAFVEEGAISKAVWFIRNALGDTSKKRFIQTVPRRGYRFVAPVHVLNDPADEEFKSEYISTGFRLPHTNGDRGPLPGDKKSALMGELRSEPNAGTGEANPLGQTEPDRRQWFSMGVGLSLLVVAALVIDLSLGWNGFLGRGVSTRIAAVPIKPRGTDNEEAYRYYQQAMNLSEERGIENVIKSLEYLERAVAADPNYAVAWAAKAHIHRDIVGHTDSDQKLHYEKSMEAAEKALSIDPELSDAHSAICQNKLRYEYDVPGAELSCKKAIELDPNSPVAQKTYANFLYARGRFDEALAAIKTAIDLQPVSYRNQQIKGLALHYARRYDEAEKQFKALLELNPNHSYIHSRLVRIYEEQGKDAEAFEYFIKMRALQKADAEELKGLKNAYEKGGWRAVQLEAIKAAEASPNPRHYLLACQYAMIGDKDKALTSLEKAYQERSFMIAMIQLEPQLDSLRSEPRYLELVKKIGFPPI